MKTTENSLIRISELVKKSEVPHSTLMFYLAEGLITYEKKTKGGFRLFDEEKILKILGIIKAVKEESRLTIAEIKELLDEGRKTKESELYEKPKKIIKQ